MKNYTLFEIQAKDIKRVVLNSGEELRLEAQTSTGYLWELDSGVIEGVTVEESMGAVDNDRVVGGSNTQTFVAQGKGKFRVCYQRPWETEKPWFIIECEVVE